MSTQRRVDFPGLDTVRALGALAVLGTHVGFWSGAYGLGLVGTAWSRLDVGVALFFVLSGFLLSRPYLVRARTATPAEPYGRYLRKRALRVLPVFWVVAVAALLVVPDNHGLGPGRWVRTLTLTDLYFRDGLPQALTQMWSLTTEIAFYLVLPLIMLGWVRLTRGRRADGAVLGMVVASAALSVVWMTARPAWLEAHAPFSPQWLPTYLVWFVVGIALAHVHVHRDLPAAGRLDLVGGVERLGAQPGVCWALAAALFLVAATPLAGPSLLVPGEPSQLTAKTLLYAVIGGLVVLATAFAPPAGRYARAMAHPVGRHLGRISYCVFCVHVLVLHLVSMATPWKPFTGATLPILVVTVVVSLGLAELLHRFVEVPAMRWRPRDAAPPAVTTSSDSEVTVSS